MMITTTAQVWDTFHTRLLHFISSRRRTGDLKTVNQTGSWPGATILQLET